MTSLDYRRLRQVELLHFLMQRFGRSKWRAMLAKELGIHRNESGRWLLEDRNGSIQNLVEKWAETVGFHSVYDSSLAQFRHHEILLNQVLGPALTRRDALAASGTLKERVNKGALPVNAAELDQLFAALGFDSIGRG